MRDLESPRTSQLMRGRAAPLGNGGLGQVACERPEWPSGENEALCPDISSSRPFSTVQQGTSRERPLQS